MNLRLAAALAPSQACLTCIKEYCPMKSIGFAAAAALVLTSSGAAAPADAQRRGDRAVERTVVRTTVVHRDNGHHYGWRNKQRRVRVCRTVWRNHHRNRVCTWRYRR
jgi:hypothetical protein